MQEINEQNFSGERAMFWCKDTRFSYCVFDEGESPLKHSQNLELNFTLFKWKYPLWYSKNARLESCTFYEMARAGVWYSSDIFFNQCTIEAPKNFRRSKNITLQNVTLPNAAETLWSCENVTLKDVSARGDYFAMNSTNVSVENLNLAGNYSFDGVKNLEIKNSKIISKDAFWNSQNVTVTGSFISGEYLGWNSKNITFIDCVIQSEQGMCYIDNVVLKNCKTINTNLAFEYSSVQAEISSGIDSVKNPIGGRIRAQNFGEVILEKERIDPAKTQIEQI
ncbi:DUF3737 family protein [Campylobacter curvus]|uniref:DUF3737 family protein n=1 Tax=Campylobacter curvus TaxID=200 RepID=UPI0014701ACD|nr:DUF3737 family protein [Campylobacter curvus]